MPKTAQNKTNKLIDTILAEGRGKDGRKSDALLESYVRLFYAGAPLEYLSSTRPAYLYAAAVEHWKFIRERRKPVPRKVRVYNPDVKRHGWMTERTVIETCAKDSPFILDSITGALTNSGYHIYEVIHPVLHLKRDSQGNITEFFEKEEKKAAHESVMHFQISHIADKNEQRKLKNELLDVLNHVHHAINDWKNIEKKVHDIIGDLDIDAPSFTKKAREETKDFLRWAISNNYIFLGYRQYSFIDSSGKPKLKTVKGSELGVFKIEPKGSRPRGLAALPPESFEKVRHPILLEITKSGRKSVVHRVAHMDYIGIKQFDKNGKAIGEHRILGLFTSAVYYQSARLIPIIREKIDAVMRRSGFNENSHNGKALLTVLENYPRDELLQISEDDLYSIGIGIVQLSARPRTKLFVRTDRFTRFVSCLVFIPRDRFNTQLREKVQKVLENAFQGSVRDYYIQVTESPLARVHVLVQLDSDKPAEPDLSAVEEELIEITNSWNNGLRDTLIKKLGERAGEQLYIEYVDAFPEAFKDHYHFGGTFCDILKIEDAYHKNDLVLDLYQLEDDGESSYQLKLYRPDTLVTLSDVLPILENMGFHAVDELTYFVQPAKKPYGVWIHHFRLRLSRAMLIDKKSQNGDAFERFKEEFEIALYKIWHHEVENDALDKLVVRAAMKWRDVSMLRAYAKYIQQIGFPYSHEFITSAVARQPVLTKLIVELFYARFGPTRSQRNRLQQMKALLADINQELIKVDNMAEDKVIRQIVDTIMATLRTNYFQKNEEGEYKSYISLKLDSKAVPNLPLPRLYREIFVYSRDIEGIHLRGGKVARGGLRWSDRIEDFRTEILGLVKAQMTKNSVIVPVGSKGGFVVKHPPEGTREEVAEHGEECYKTYLSSLLDITDNIVKGKIVRPKNVVCHDGDDPYLVVAADKGTATFSDTANAVSRGYGFWLDDAFASGGSAGYDHKKMGITARGAWVAVQRHFMEMGIDIQKEDFTVIGVGGMSGDVFGNGMLLSRHIKLVAAWGHSNIFIDPNPDPETSFKERQRIFRMKRSTWEDYNSDLISKGGGIFDRWAKTITITKEMKKRFDIKENSLSPDELIIYLLKANVDLFWNGGIGTYVKAESESNEDAGDKANDNARVNGKDLRFKVVGEGGNLGFTQLGRVEFALNGGRINTDSIDNSGGVDCSDHEVNIKIALNKAVEKRKISLKERNRILAEMTDDVAELVMRDNELQTLALSIAEQQGPARLEQEMRLIEALEGQDLLNRQVEFLPEDETIAQRQSIGQGLTRPELSVTLAYSKNVIDDEMIDTNLPDDPYFHGDLLRYFPEFMHKRFKQEIEKHELKREIIANSIANSIVNRMGSTFYHRVKEDTGMKGCDVARAYTVTRDAFELRELWDEIEKLGSKIASEVQIKLYIAIQQMVERSTRWLLRNFSQPLDVATLVSDFKPGIIELERHLDKILSPELLLLHEARLKSYLGMGVPSNLAKRIADLDAMGSACDIVHVARDGKLSIRVVGTIYYELSSRLHLGWMRNSAHALSSHSHWENLAVQTLTETLFDVQMQLTADVVKIAKKGDNAKKALQTWYDANPKKLERYDAFINDLRRQDSQSQSMLTVAIQRVEALLGS